MTQICHKLITSTAMDMAAELYETLMRDDLWYITWKDRNGIMGPGPLSPRVAERLRVKFIRRTWPSLISEARSTLFGMLGGDLPESLKSEIYEALMLDASLGKHRSSTRVVGAVNER